MSTTSEQSEELAEVPGGDTSGRQADQWVRRMPQWLTVLLWQLAVVAILVVLWQVLAATGTGDPLVVSSPRKVGAALLDLLGDPEFWDGALDTIYATLVSFALASVTGIAVGLGLGLLPRTERVFTPFIDALNSTPRIALAPVFIVIFGITFESKVALAYTVGLFVILLSSRAGVHALDSDILKLMTVMNASKTQIFFKALIMSALPSIFTGLRLGLIYCLLGVVTSELLSAPKGLGQMVSIYSHTFRMDLVYAVILCMILFATALNQSFAFVERRLTGWKS